MIQKTDAVLLKKQDLRETSLFLTFYTKTSGKIYGVMKGIRGQKGQYGFSPQVFSLNEVVFYERKDKEIYTVSQCELKDFFATIRESLERTSYASYFIELINSLTAVSEKNEAMFDLLVNSLKMLCENASPRRTARVFEIRLLSLLGLMPQLRSCIGCSQPLGSKALFSLKNGGVMCGACAAKERGVIPVAIGTLNFMDHVNRSDWEFVSRIKVSQEVGKQVENILRRFMDYHLHLKPKSLEFMEKVLA
ncbi:MAG: DNA repair protein RecO [Candidatus Omnitrophica bacterium]|nr:DNA repair protein RecO [Candidatus Omnitrophota bacterium]